MSKILVTGATGNVGAEVVRELQTRGLDSVSAVSKPEGLKPGRARVFNFADHNTWEPALEGVDRVFLIRPPAISDVRTYLFPFIDLMRKRQIAHIVFLSLQGVQFNPLTPHHKVEKYMRQTGVPYTFVRPNFFMQNLNTFYRDDIRDHDEIYLPAGKGRTAFVDVRDVGAVVAETLSDSRHIGQAYTLSGSQSLDYHDVSRILSETLGRQITYKNPSVREYVDRLRAAGMPEDFVRVQKMLYFVVRHNLSADTGDTIARLLGRPATTFEQYARDYADSWRW